jgi:Flp pilus assembly protein TadD
MTGTPGLSSFQFRRVTACFGLLLLTASWSGAFQEPSGNFERGLAYFRQERYTDALPLFEKAAALAPDSADTWHVLGLTLLKLNAYARAVDPLRRACELEAREGDACYLEGRTLYLLARYDEAEEPLAKALRGAPAGDQPKIQRAIALNLNKSGKAAEAEEHFRAAIRAYQPAGNTHEDPRFDYGSFLVRQGRAGEALDPLQKALAASPRSAAINGETGRALLDLNRPSEALPYLRNAAAYDPTAWSLRMLLGKTLLRLGRTEEGERELREASEGWAKTGQGSSKVQ